MHSRVLSRLAPLAWVAIFVAPPCCALTEIESTGWIVPSVPSSCRRVAVVFLGRVTARDRTEGVRFSLQERDPGGNELLTDVALPWTAPLPAVGTELRLYAEFCLSCDESELTGGPIRNWTVTWCEPPSPTQVRFEPGAVPPLAVGRVGPEVHEFVLVDENGQAGMNPSPEDFFSCTSQPMKVGLEPRFPTPYELVEQGRAVADPEPWGAAGLQRVDRRPAADATGTIGVFFDPQGLIACGEVPANSMTSLYVVARTEGVTSCGITGAELRITGFPAGWIGSASVPANAIVIGDPLGPAGSNMAFYSCQAGSPGFVLLYTVQVLATTTVSNQLIQITQRNPSSNPLFSCPLVTLCDAPVYTIACVQGTGAIVNPLPGSACEPTVGVEPRTWSRVKRLYD